MFHRRFRFFDFNNTNDINFVFFSLYKWVLTMYLLLMLNSYISNNGFKSKATKKQFLILSVIELLI